MKYEMVFGDEKLFDGAPDGAEMVYETANHARVYYKKCNSLKFFSNSKWVRVLNEKSMIIYAMRRIIKEPKRWTWEDKKAGLLPEVLGKVTTYDGKSYSFVGESCHDNQWSLKDDATGKVYHTPIGDIFPIETPAEKAQREEDEFVEKLASGVARYDSFINGARAAYRKLKGDDNVS